VGAGVTIFATGTPEKIAKSKKIVLYWILFGKKY